jgi:hypothetical protein
LLVGFLRVGDEIEIRARAEKVAGSGLEGLVNCFFLLFLGFDANILEFRATEP